MSSTLPLTVSVVRPSTPTAPVDVPDPIAEILLDDAVLELLPEQEWCEQCATDSDDDPGMPQDVIADFTDSDPDWDVVFGLGKSPLHHVRRLACGHSIVELCGTTGDREQE